MYHATDLKFQQLVQESHFVKFIYVVDGMTMSQTVHGITDISNAVVDGPLHDRVLHFPASEF